MAELGWCMSRAIITDRKPPPSFFYPFFERYYSQYFDYIHRVVNDWLEVTIPLLLNGYKLIGVVGNDEILVPDPYKYADLGDYLDRCQGSVIRCIGYNIIEMPGDARLDLTGKITDQRSYWQRDEQYDKPVLTRVGTKFGTGWHTCHHSSTQDSDLYLFHLRDADATGSIARRHIQGFTIKDFRYRRSQAELIPNKWKVI